MSKSFFLRHPAVTPSIYAYEEPETAALAGFLKIGFTNGDIQKRVVQQYPTARPGKPPYKIVFVDEPWTDEKLYAKYGLTPEEIAFVESIIRPMKTSEENV